MWVKNDNGGAAYFDSIAEATAALKLYGYQTEDGIVWWCYDSFGEMMFTEICAEM